MTRTSHPAPLGAVLGVTFLGSVNSGAFWSAIFFVTDRIYGFSPAKNLALAAVMGSVYTLLALKVGAIVRALAERMSPRRILVASLVVQSGAAFLPAAFPRAEPILWTFALLGVAAQAITWPIVESYLTAARHGPEMRAAMGWFNVTWTSSVAVPLLLMPLVAERNIALILGVSGLASTLALLPAARFSEHPAEHELEASEAHIGPDYPALMRSAGWLLPLSYVISSTLAPVLPHRLRAIEIRVDLQSAVASLWMVARFATLAFLWRAHFWHGRWTTLAVGAAALTLGLAAVLLAGTWPVMVAGLLVFGLGMGITYAAALYYTMAVGRAAIDAGSKFEALVGAGYAVGPLLGLAGQRLATPSRAAETTVLLTWIVVVVAAYPAFRAYLETRRVPR
jgi:hypothetical protein